MNASGATGTGQETSAMHNPGVRVNVYQYTLGFFTCGVEFPKRNL